MKTLGQVAHEGRTRLMMTEPIPWERLPAWQRDDFESMARAVAEDLALMAECHDLGTPDGHEIAAAIRARSEVKK